MFIEPVIIAGSIFIGNKGEQPTTTLLLLCINSPFQRRKLNNETYIPIISLSEIVGFLMLKINYQKLRK